MVERCIFLGRMKLWCVVSYSVVLNLFSMNCVRLFCWVWFSVLGVWVSLLCWFVR